MMTDMCQAFLSRKLRTGRCITGWLMLRVASAICIVIRGCGCQQKAHIVLMSVHAKSCLCISCRRCTQELSEPASL